DEDRVGVACHCEDVLRARTLAHAVFGIEPRERLLRRIERGKWTVGDGDDGAGHGRNSGGRNESARTLRQGRGQRPLGRPRCGTATVIRALRFDSLAPRSGERVPSECEAGEGRRLALPSPGSRFALATLSRKREREGPRGA